VLVLALDRGRFGVRSHDGPVSSPHTPPMSIGVLVCNS
jgi:hypothetical protein